MAEVSDLHNVLLSLEVEADSPGASRTSLRPECRSLSGCLWLKEDAAVCKVRLVAAEVLMDFTHLITSEFVPLSSLLFSLVSFQVFL